MKILRFAIFFVTVAVLTAGFIGTVFKKSDENNEMSVGTVETLVKDYSNFAKGQALITDKEITVSAKSVILCTDSGIVLYEKQADVPLPMASITKVMTAVIALEKTEDIKKEVEVNPKAVGIEGSSVYLKPGEKVSFEMLLYSIMLESANDAASAIAYAVCGSEDEFVKAMNEKAVALSMTSTAFKNPHGLSEDGHYTTARDYAKLMSYALENRTFTEIIGTKKKVYPSYDGEMTRVLTNHNRLLNTYKNMIGGKTGFTKSSGRTLVTAAEKDGTKLICITINAPNDWNDHVSLYEKGFDSVRTEIFTTEDCTFGIPVACGTVESVLCGTQKEIRITVKPDEEVTLKYFCPKFLFAPIESGKEVGRIEIYVNGEKKTEEKIYTLTGIEGKEKEEKSGIIKKITDFINEK